MKVERSVRAGLLLSIGVVVLETQCARDAMCPRHNVVVKNGGE
ncbi:MAG: hypothetical protein RLZ37_1530 [Actinomycetota bacterium]|jgi:hypothetical protein